MAERLKDGWVFGNVKNPEAKTHPCLVPYTQLPPDQQAKDLLYIQVVRAVAQSLGYRSDYLPAERAQK